MSRTQQETMRRPKYWVKLTLFLLGALGVLVILYVGSQAFTTLRQLDVIEADRDQWQHPTEVIEALNLKNGDSVVDLGCGSGYFSLKLSTPVGVDGKVIAEDIRRLPLAFLWVRALRKGKHNLRVLLGDVDNPHLNPNSVNEVLISNTYHEFTAPKNILDHVHRALVPGGRLVIIDRSPKDPQQEKVASQEHEIASAQVESDLRQTGFDIDRRQDRFIENDPMQESWWIIVAHRP